MKKPFIFFAFIALIATACMNKENTSYGYIPKDVFPEVHFDTTEVGFTWPTTTVKVVIENDTVNVEYNYSGHFPGSYYVLFKGKHPRTINEKVYVRIIKNEGLYYVAVAYRDSIQYLSNVE